MKHVMGEFMFVMPRVGTFTLELAVRFLALLGLFYCFNYLFFVSVLF